MEISVKKLESPTEEGSYRVINGPEGRYKYRVEGSTENKTVDGELFRYAINAFVSLGAKKDLTLKLE